MLKTLREKPHHIKQIVSVVITTVIFSGIVFVWWSSRDARSRELEVQEKTVSPLDGVTSMFDGFITDFVDKMAGSPAESISQATSTQEFDLGQVVIIDPTATTTPMEPTAQPSLLPTGQAPATSTQTR